LQQTSICCGSGQLIQHLIDAFKHNASVYGQYNDSECKELENIREYIAKLATMHAANLKMDTVVRFKQKIAKHFETSDVNLSVLYQQLCAAREAAVSEFERKEKGKYTCAAME
jgi:uncharacterized protein (DUF488 family)